MIKILLLNLPHQKRITRRYMCTYESPTSLFPPAELLSIGGILKQKKELQIKLIDCIATQKNETESLLEINKFKPQYIVTLIGFETFENDISFLNKLKSKFPNIKIIGFGHYPTIFSHEILKKSTIDFIVQGEPEYELADFFESISTYSNILPEGLLSLNSENEKTPIQVKRLKTSQLNFKPNISLLTSKNYFEPLMPQPLGIIQSARGCPYQCNFCVKSYGTKLTYKSESQILEEIIDWQENYGAKSIRFIDDTFTISESRVIKLCNLIKKENIKIPWTCLSRLDTLTERMALAMKEAGCKRIYFGIESGSQRILDLYEKGYNIKEAHQVINFCAKLGIETVGFFMTGLPDETEKDFEETLKFLRDSKLTFAGVGELTIYPGTALFGIYENDLEFSLFPYINKFKDPSVRITFNDRKQRFEKEFYNLKKITQLSLKIMKQPKSSYNFGKNILSSKQKGFYSIIPSISN